MSIIVLGAGAWGTALATMLAGGDEPVTLWGRDAKAIEEINQTRSNRAYLGDLILNEKLALTSDLSKVQSADIVLCVTPAQSFSVLMETLVPLLNPHTKLVLCAKGIDRASGKMLHELAGDHIPKNQIAALSGPSFAADVARGLPTAVALATNEIASAKELATRLARPSFRIYASDDLTGVELGGALKNVLAIAVGVVRGLELGASAEAALIARGFAELNRIAVAKGADKQTLAGLSGLGDLVLSCSSPQSRNFSYGMALARGDDLSNLPLAEGAHTAEMALKLARKLEVDAPIIEKVVGLLNNEQTPHDAVRTLLARPLREET